jgi:hypothetical protein
VLVVHATNPPNAVSLPHCKARMQIADQAIPDCDAVVSFQGVFGGMVNERSAA